MLTALFENRTIFVDDFPIDYLKKQSERKKLLCPDCGDILIAREGSQKRSHFSHLRAECSSPFSEAETAEHETGKMAILAWLKSQFGENRCFAEKRVEATNQRSDTYVESDCAAFEFQCSPIQSKTWENRCDLYRQAGVRDFWILGYSMHKRSADGNGFCHRLNGLEQAVLQRHGKIVYYDVLTKQFVFLHAEERAPKRWEGAEYFFKPEEVSAKGGDVSSKFDFFMDIQKKRRSFASKEADRAKETSSFIEEVRKDVQAEKELATPKQLNYIKFLLAQQNKKIPYKFHSLLKGEAAALIDKLKEGEEKRPS